MVSNVILFIQLVVHMQFALCFKWHIALNCDHQAGKWNQCQPKFKPR